MSMKIFLEQRKYEENECKISYIECNTICMLRIEQYGTSFIFLDTLYKKKRSNAHKHPIMMSFILYIRQQIQSHKTYVLFYI